MYSARSACTCWIRVEAAVYCALRPARVAASPYACPSRISPCALSRAAWASARSVSPAKKEPTALLISVTPVLNSAPAPAMLGDDEPDDEEKSPIVTPPIYRQ